MRRMAAILMPAILSACGHASELYSPTDILSQYGYTVQVPPSALHGPGNLVWKKQAPALGEEQVALGDICSPTYMSFPETLSRSGSEKIGFARNHSFNFDSDALKKLGLTLSAKYVSSVTLSFSNTEVLEYSLEDLEHIKATLGPVCTDLLRKQRDAGNAFQVVGAFKADMAYSIKYSGELSAAVQALVKEELAAEFGIKFEGGQGQAGQGLYYGVYLEQA